MRQLGQHVCMAVELFMNEAARSACTAVELFMNEAARSACMYGCRALHE